MAKTIDLTGLYFGQWRVLRLSTIKTCGLTCWDCQCSCGSLVVVIGSSLKSGRTNSCGCIKKGKGKESLINKRFGRLTVTERLDNRGGHIYWRCLCSCGKVKDISGNNLKAGITTSCGCLNRERTSIKSTKDLSGCVFGRLTVINKADINVRGRVCWNCVCECGTNLIISSKELLRGHKKSCGCLRNDLSIIRWQEYRRSKGKDPNVKLSDFDEQIRGILSSSGIKKNILLRDRFCCIICRSKRKLNIHHIIPLAHNEALFFEESNMITLCGDCHMIAHQHNNKKINFCWQRLLIWINRFQPV